MPVWADEVAGGPQIRAQSETSGREQRQVDLAAYPDVAELMAQGKTAQALQSLRAKQADNENNPQYFNLLGILSLETGDYDAAAGAFERVVLMQPDNAGAWLDLAISSAEAGNVAVATDYFDYVEKEFSPPPPLRRVIAAYRTRIAFLLNKGKTSKWRRNVDASVGVDSNANSGLQSNSIPLTIGRERIDLALDPAYRARRDTYAQIGVGSRYTHQAAFGQFEFSAGAKQRSYHREHDFSTLDVQLGTGLRQSKWWGDLGIWAHAEHLSLGGHSLWRNLRLVTQLERPQGTCRVAINGEVEWRRYVTLRSLDSDLVWLQLGTACDWHITRVPIQFIAVARAGIDQPTSTRAGGRTRRTEWIGQLVAPMAWGMRAEITAALGTAQDADGYSPLLENNAVRHITRSNLRISVAAPFYGGTEAVVAIDSTRFTSNLSLFEQSGKNLTIGIQAHF